MLWYYCFCSSKQSKWLCHHFPFYTQLLLKHVLHICSKRYRNNTWTWETQTKPARENLIIRKKKWRASNISIHQVFQCSLEAKFTFLLKWSPPLEHLCGPSSTQVKDKGTQYKVASIYSSGNILLQQTSWQCVFSKLLLYTVPCCPRADSLYIQRSVCAAAVGIHMICSHWPLPAALHDFHSDTCEQTKHEKATFNVQVNTGEECEKKERAQSSQG